MIYQLLPVVTFWLPKWRSQKKLRKDHDDGSKRGHDLKNLVVYVLSRWGLEPMVSRTWFTYIYINIYIYIIYIIYYIWFKWVIQFKGHKRGFFHVSSQFFSPDVSVGSVHVGWDVSTVLGFPSLDNHDPWHCFWRVLRGTFSVKKIGVIFVVNYTTNAVCWRKNGWNISTWSSICRVVLCRHNYIYRGYSQLVLYSFLVEIINNWLILLEENKCISITWFFGRTDWKRYTAKNTPDFLEMILIRLFYWVGTPFHKQYPYSIYRWCWNTSKHLQAPQQQQTHKKTGCGGRSKIYIKKPTPHDISMKFCEACETIDDLPQEFVKIHMWNNSICWNFEALHPWSHFLNQGTPGASVSCGVFSRLLQLQHLNKMDIVSNLESIRWSMFNISVGFML